MKIAAESAEAAEAENVMAEVKRATAAAEVAGTVEATAMEMAEAGETAEADMGGGEEA